MQTLTEGATVTLNNGVQIPQIGLGVWKCEGDQAYDAVTWALECGYRHIDSAAVYGNEAEVGKAIRASGIPRQEIFVTTKLWTDDHSSDRVKPAFERSCDLLGLDYVDLYLSHFPVAGKRLDAWRALEEIAHDKRCRAVGISNYTINHVQEMLAQTSVVPTINQVELHPFLYQRNLIQYCHSKNIRIQAYSPLTHGQRLHHPAVVKIAEKYQRSNAQILIRWSLQHDLIVLPKSKNRERIRENLQVFDFTIDAEDMAALDGLHEDFRTCWDPTSTP